MEDLPYEIQIDIIQRACTGPFALYILSKVMLLNKYWNGVAHDAMEQEPLKTIIKEHVKERQNNMFYANYNFFNSKCNKEPEMPVVKYINKRRDIPHIPKQWRYRTYAQDVEDETFKEKICKKGYHPTTKYKTPKEFKAFAECSAFSGIRKHLTPRFFYGDYRRKDHW